MLSVRSALAKAVKSELVRADIVDVIRAEGGDCARQHKNYVHSETLTKSTPGA